MQYIPRVWFPALGIIFQGSSMSWHISVLYFLLLYNISLHRQSTFCLFIHQFVDICTVSTWWLSGRHGYELSPTSLCANMFSVLFDIYLGVGLLGQMVILRFPMASKKTQGVTWEPGTRSSKTGVCVWSGVTHF